MTTEPNENAAQHRRREVIDRQQAAYKRQLDERLDEALSETFPASDPVALTPRRKRPD